jgi:hypothetical protein
MPLELHFVSFSLRIIFPLSLSYRLPAAAAIAIAFSPLRHAIFAADAAAADAAADACRYAPPRGHAIFSPMPPCLRYDFFHFFAAADAACSFAG